MTPFFFLFCQSHLIYSFILFCSFVIKIGGDKHTVGGMLQHRYLVPSNGSNMHEAPLHPVSIGGEPIVRTPESLEKMLRSSVARGDGTLIWQRICAVSGFESYAAALRSGLLMASYKRTKLEDYWYCMEVKGSWNLKIEAAIAAGSTFLFSVVFFIFCVSNANDVIC